MYCLFIVALFMELRGAYRSGVDFNVIILEVSYKEMGLGLLWGGVDLSRHHVNILILQLEEG